jgi:hypothetical protein
MARATISDSALGSMEVPRRKWLDAIEYNDRRD